MLSWARLVELVGQDHAPLGVDVDAVAGEMEEFLTGALTPDGLLATVMMTDIVGSTAPPADVGGAA